MKKQKSLLRLGLFNLLIPIPFFFLALVLCYLLLFGLGRTVLCYEALPIWFQILTFSPPVILTLWQIISGIRGIRMGRQNKEAPNAKTCIVLSVLGLIEQILLWVVLFYLATHV